MPSIEITTTLSQAGAVATLLGPYLIVALAFVFGPRLLKLGLRLVKGGE